MIIEDVTDFQLLIAVLVGEASRQPFIGKVAIACVIRNRKNNLLRWPDTWRSVILQPKQFSVFNTLPRSDSIPPSFKQRYFTSRYRDLWWRECRLVAFGAIWDWYGDVTNGATHYFNPTLVKRTPAWAKGHESILVVGEHHFYNLATHYH